MVFLVSLVNIWWVCICQPTWKLGVAMWIVLIKEKCEHKHHESLPGRSFKNQHVIGPFLAVTETGNALYVRYSVSQGPKMKIIYRKTLRQSMIDEKYKCKINYIFFILFYFLIYFAERERERAQVGERGRERENSKQDPHCDSHTGAQCHEPWDHYLSQNQKPDTTDWATQMPQIVLSLTTMLLGSFFFYHSITYPILIDTGKEVKLVSQGHTANKWKSQGLNPDALASEFACPSHSGIWHIYFSWNLRGRIKSSF